MSEQKSLFDFEVDYQQVVREVSSRARRAARQRDSLEVSE